MAHSEPLSVAKEKPKPQACFTDVHVFDDTNEERIENILAPERSQ